ncbi:hypothetical protein ACF0H5_009877 [Mactra antiquata]
MWITTASSILYKLKQLRCQANVDWTDSVISRTSISCSRLCAKNTSCTVVHYQQSESLCKIDDRPFEDIVEYPLSGPVWKSLFKSQCAVLLLGLSQLSDSISIRNRFQFYLY